MKAVDGELKALMRSVGVQTAAARGKRASWTGSSSTPSRSPGKRIRPALVLLTAPRHWAEALDADSLISLAAAVEVLHAASLVHDDIIDDADSRRHQVSLNKRFGNRVAVLAGDILYTHFFSLITGLVTHRAAKALRPAGHLPRHDEGNVHGRDPGPGGRAPRAGPWASRSIVEIAIGQDRGAFLRVLQDGGPPRDGRAGPRSRCLGEFGLHFGLAFQMADDLVDKDHGLESGVDLKATALEYADRARGRHRHGSPSAHRDSLRDLVDYVIASAIP